MVIPERTEVGDEWPMLGRTASRSGTSPVGLRGPLEEGWGFWPGAPERISPTGPVIKYERIFAGLGDGAYYALDQATGLVRWRFAPGGAGPLATPAVFDGVLYAGAPDGSVCAIDAFRGRPIWRRPVGEPVLAAPAVTGGLVYLGLFGGTACAMEAKTGAIAWRQPLGEPISRPPALGDDMVYLLTDGGTLFALDSQGGETVWRRQVEAKGHSPVFAELVLLLGPCAIDPRTGDEVWRLDGEVGNPVAGGDQVVYGHGAVDLFTGQYRWRHDGPPLGGLIACGASIIGVGDDGALYALAAASGETLWRRPLGSAAVPNLAVAPGGVAVTLADGGVKWLRSKDSVTGRHKD